MKQEVRNKEEKQETRYQKNIDANLLNAGKRACWAGFDRGIEFLYCICILPLLHCWAFAFEGHWGRWRGVGHWRSSRSASAHACIVDDWYHMYHGNDGHLVAVLS